MEWKKAVYTWSEDYSTVVAVRVSKDDPAVVITETAAAVGTVTKAPTCGEMGVTTYKATFEDHRFSTQRKKVKNIEMLPHTPVTSPAVPATDQEDGITKGICCAVCQEVLTAGHTIDHQNQIHTPERLSVIKDRAFENTGAHQIILSENVVSIGKRAFANCADLGIVSIPASVTEIASDAFEGDELITLQVEADSYAWQYAMDNNIDFILK